MIETLIKLPLEIINLIKEYVPRHVLAVTNREYYLLYHKYIKFTIQHFENYIRNCIRQDHFFVFEKVLQENFNKWTKNTNYLYKNMIFKNYTYFIMYYCIENESTNCRKIIIDFLKELGLYKNLHKKNIVKYIRWKN